MDCLCLYPSVSVEPWVSAPSTPTIRTVHRLQLMNLWVIFVWSSCFTRGFTLDAPQLMGLINVWHKSAILVSYNLVSLTKKILHVLFISFFPSPLHIEKKSLFTFTFYEQLLPHSLALLDILPHSYPSLSFIFFTVFAEIWDSISLAIYIFLLLSVIRSLSRLFAAFFLSSWNRACRKESL